MKKWHLLPNDPQQIESLVNACQISPITATVLCNRGIHTAAAYHAIIDPALADLPDPFLFKDMDRAVARIDAAIRNNETIAIHGDYDVDGLTATAVLTHFLKSIGASVRPFIPDRMVDGYGLQTSSIDTLKNENVSLIITVDCGVTAIKEVAYAQSRGVDMIITDHHEPRPELPAAAAVINPKRADCQFPFDGVSGVGVALFVIMALRRHLRDRGFFETPEHIPSLIPYLEWVVLGTIADVSPMVSVNRILVRYGLAQLTKSKRPGIRALKEVSGLKDKEISVGHVGFILAPRLNAAGRLKHAKLALNLLLGEDDAECLVLAEALNTANKERQAMEARMVEEAMALIDASETIQNRKAIVVGSPDWHEGVVGIVASRLVEKYHKPTIVVAFRDGVGKGSARSILGVHLLKSLDPCHGRLISYGGHEMAAGIKVEISQFQSFYDDWSAAVTAQVTAETFVPVLRVDSEVELRDVNRPLILELTRLEPFGPSHREPLFSSTRLRVVDRRIVGVRHLKVTLEKDGVKIPAMGFGMGHLIEQLSPMVDIAYYPEFNDYWPAQPIQLRLKDIRSSDEM